MKIVHIEDFFHPNAGYQINVLPKYMVKQGHNVTIVTSEMDKIPESLTSFFGRENIEQSDEKYTQQTGVNIIRLPLRGFLSGRAIFDKNLEKTIKEIMPEILYVHGNDTLTGMKYIWKISKLEFPIISDSHMLEMASANPFNKIYRMCYKVFITPKIKKHQLKIIRTQDDSYVNRCLGIPLKQCPWISVGSDTMLFYPNNEVKKAFREQHKISMNDFVVVYTGKLDDSKGGKFLAETLLQKFYNTRNKKVVIIVIGNTAGEYGKEVERIFERSENKIIRISTQKYIDLAQFYQSADLSIFPKQCSLSFYDAQACGLPVISEDNNINIDRLMNNNGFNFIAGNINDFREKIIKCIEMDDIKYKKMSENAYEFVKENYDYEIIAQQYTSILANELQKFKEKRS